jgi:hypothetical protein
MHDETMRELRAVVRSARAAGRISLVVVSICWGGDGPDGRRFDSNEVRRNQL